ncbi:MAG: exonuclease [Clostridia bacterium]|nr:exonuclease [Clostridia bacterium]
MRYIIIDFEWNGTVSRITKEYFNELIELGGVKLDDDLKVIDSFRCLIRPNHHKKLTGRVKRITNITNDDVKAGKGFVAAFSDFEKWVGDGENCFMSWGTGDILVLMENLKYYGMTDRLSVMKNYCDAQVLCQQALDIDNGQQPGLSLVAQKLGISCDDMDMHRALDDSVVTAKCISAVWNRELFDSLVYRADDSFYDRITFKQCTISDMNNPLLENVSYKTKCPDCGRFMKRKTKLRSKNHSICADYVCSMCGKQFFVRHTFRLKYEGVTHKVSVKEKQAPEQESENQ